MGGSAMYGATLEALHLHKPSVRVGSIEMVDTLENVKLWSTVFLITCHVLAHGRHNWLKLLLLAYLHVLSWVVEALLTTHLYKGVGGVLASLTTVVKQCCGSSLVIIAPCFWLGNVIGMPHRLIITRCNITRALKCILLPEKQFSFLSLKYTIMMIHCSFVVV